MSTTAGLIRVTNRFLSGQLEKEEAAAKLRPANAALDRHLQALTESFDAVAKDGLRKACEELVEASGAEDAQARREAVTLYVDAAEKLAGMIRQGAAVKLALNAPPEAKAALPSSEDTKKVAELIGTVTKLLGSGD